MLHALHGRAETSRGFGMTQTNSWHLWLFPCGSFAGTSHHLFKFFLKEISSQFTLQHSSDSFMPCYFHKEFVQDLGSPEFHQIKWCDVQPSFWTFFGQFNASQITQHLKHESETRSFSSHWPQNMTVSNFDKIEGSTSTQVTPLDRPFVPSTVLTRMMQWQPVPLFAPLGTTWRRLWTPRGRATATAVAQDHPPGLEGYAPHYGWHWPSGGQWKNTKCREYHKSKDVQQREHI